MGEVGGGEGYSSIFPLFSQKRLILRLGCLLPVRRSWGVVGAALLLVGA